MRLDFDLTFTKVTYLRKTFGGRYDGHLSENAGYYAMDTWEMSAGHVAVRSSLRVNHHSDIVKECGDEGCRHCPIKVRKWTTITWHGFDDVAEAHRDAVRKLGATRSAVECLVEESRAA
jgi:hypothetical protein